MTQNKEKCVINGKKGKKMDNEASGPLTKEEMYALLGNWAKIVTRRPRSMTKRNFFKPQKIQYSENYGKRSKRGKKEKRQANAQSTVKKNKNKQNKKKGGKKSKNGKDENNNVVKPMLVQKKEKPASSDKSKGQTTTSMAKINFFMPKRIQKKRKNDRKRERGKKANKNVNRDLVLKEEGQAYAQVTKMLGNCYLEATCFDGRTRLCHIRGALRNKVRIFTNDIVLIGLRDYQDEKADVILKYSVGEALQLKSSGEIPKNVTIAGKRFHLNHYFTLPLDKENIDSYISFLYIDRILDFVDK